MVRRNQSFSDAYADAGNLTGVLFGVYNITATVFALILPRFYRFLGKKKTHFLVLALCGIGFIAMLFTQDRGLLYLLPMVAVGIAWASILATPYAIISGALPAKKMGLYMGLFNFFITFPQIVNGLLGAWIVKYVFNNQAIYCLTLEGICMLLAAVSTLFVQEDETNRYKKQVLLDDTDTLYSHRGQHSVGSILLVCIPLQYSDIIVPLH